MLIILELIITELEWESYIRFPILSGKFIERGIKNLKREMKELGYMNVEDEIVLNRYHPVNRFWIHFAYAFSKEFLDFIFKKMEEIL